MRGFDVCQGDRSGQSARRRYRAVIPAVVVLGLLVGSALTRAGGASGGQAAPTTKPTQDPVVTPVAGPSWLNRLGLRYGETTLGRSGATYGPPPAGATYGPPPAGPPAGPVSLPLAIGRPVVLTGADLYRLNCQSCHRAEGTGSPPEIKSVLGLVQGSSLELVRRQLRQQGRTGVSSAARAQAGRARRDLHNRVLKGGQRMPPLAHLQEADFVALYAYLTRLAGSPDASPQSQRTVSWSRLGELVIKGTCHICHDAVGPRPMPQALAYGTTIPPFTTLLEDKPVVDFITKVRSGAAVRTGDPVFHYRGRMPVFPYLQDLEVAAAYMFLVDYPPQPGKSPGR
jgi:mono/diheme cytochrome c family protein